MEGPAGPRFHVRKSQIPASNRGCFLSKYVWAIFKFCWRANGNEGWPVTTHEDNSICIDQINKDLVHDEIHDFSVPAENGGANGIANA